MTRGLAEISRLVHARGGQAMTCMGLAGMGYLIATCTSEHSRNLTFGYEFAHSLSLIHILSAPALAGALDIAPGECASLLAELKVEYEEANRGFQLREEMCIRDSFMSTPGR